MTSHDGTTTPERETSPTDAVGDTAPVQEDPLGRDARPIDIAEMDDAVHALGLIGCHMARFAGAIPRLPRDLVPRAIDAAVDAVWLGKKQSAAPTQRLALLLCIDAVVKEQEQGTGLGRLLDHHFPELGSDSDLRRISDRLTPEYRAFAESWIRWVYRGHAVDIEGYRSLATWGLLGRLAVSDVPLQPTEAPREPEPAWQCSPAQAAFGIGACLAIAHPALGARAVREASPELQEAAAHWRHRQKNRWIVASKLAEKLGMEQAKPDSFRDQWEAHVKRRQKPGWVDVQLLDPDPEG